MVDTLFTASPSQSHSVCPWTAAGKCRDDSKSSCNEAFSGIEGGDSGDCGQAPEYRRRRNDLRYLCYSRQYECLWPGSRGTGVEPMCRDTGRQSTVVRRKSTLASLPQPNQHSTRGARAIRKHPEAGAERLECHFPKFIWRLKLDHRGQNDS
jgi:hypothetical protein